ncbi:MAG: hypothetical protein ACR2J3_08165 [Aridibacter sp.]
MQILNLESENKIELTKPFWRRQFQKETTKSQKIFDWILGIILPVACFAFDPAIFKTSELWGSEPYLASLKPFAYLMSFVSVMALMAFLIWGAKLKWFNGFLAGFFLIGGIISLGIGIVLLPISLLGLMILIGALGFTPLFTALIYLRNAIRAYKSAKHLMNKKQLIQAAVLAGLFGFVTPAVLNFEIEKTLEKMRSGDAQTVRENAEYLYFVSPIVDFETLVKEYRFATTSKERKEALADVYRDITGEKIVPFHKYNSE